MFTRGHNTVSLEEIKQSDKPTGAKSLQKVQYCKDHEDEVLKLFCKTCKKVICRDCALVKHRDHDYTFIREIRPEIQQQLEALTREVQAKEVEYKSHIDYLKNIRGIGNNALATCKHKVNETCDQLKEAIESRRAALIAQLHDIHDSEKKQVDLEAEGLHFTLLKLSNSIGFTQQLLANGSDVEVVSMSVQAVQTLESLKTMNWDKDSIKPTLMRVKFDPEFEKHVNKFGATSHEIKPEDLLVKLPKETAYVGKEIKFEVHLSKEISERGYDATSELAVRLIHTTDNARTMCMLRKTEPNTWEVSYVPKAPGNYNVSVVLGNVESAPYNLYVQQLQLATSDFQYLQATPHRLPSSIWASTLSQETSTPAPSSTQAYQELPLHQDRSSPLWANLELLSEQPPQQTSEQPPQQTSAPSSTWTYQELLSEQPPQQTSAPSSIWTYQELLSEQPPQQISAPSSTRTYQKVEPKYTPYQKPKQPYKYDKRTTR